MARRLPPRGKHGRFIKRGSRAPSRKSRSSPRRVRRMPRRKKGRRKVSLITKAINGALLALALSGPLSALFRRFGDLTLLPRDIIMMFTGYDTITGTFDIKRVAPGYAPVAGAFILKKVTSWLRKTMRL